MAVELNDFRTMMGKYNLGNLVIKTNGSGQETLAKVNNARVFKSVRATAANAERNAAVRTALVNSITGYLTARGLDQARAEYLESVRVRLLGDGVRGQNLMRDDVAAILDELDHRVETNDFGVAYEKCVCSKKLLDRTVARLERRDGEYKHDDVLYKTGRTVGMMQRVLLLGNQEGFDPRFVKSVAERAGISEEQARTYLTTRGSTLLDKATLLLPYVKIPNRDYAPAEAGQNAKLDAKMEAYARRCIEEAVREIHLETQQLVALSGMPAAARAVVDALRGDAGIPVGTLVEKGELKDLLDGLAKLADGTSRAETVKFDGVVVTFKTEGRRLSATVGKATVFTADAESLLGRIMDAVGAAKRRTYTVDQITCILDDNSSLLSANGNAEKGNARRAEVSKWILASYAEISEIELQGLSRVDLCRIAALVAGPDRPSGEDVRGEIAEASAKRMYSPEMLQTIRDYGAENPDQVTFGNGYNANVPRPDPFDALAADLFCNEEVWMHDEYSDTDGSRIRQTLLRHEDAVRQLLQDGADEKIALLSNRLGVNLSRPMTVLKEILAQGLGPGRADVAAGLKEIGIEKFMPVEDAIKELLDGAMQTLQNRFKGLLGDGLVPGANVPIWKQSIDELVQNVKKSGSTREGEFFKKVMSEYLTQAPKPEKRAMLASLLRLSRADATPSEQLGALLKGAGPVFQKLLQGISESEIPAELKDVFRDIKSNLAPIPKTAVNAMLRKLVSESGGKIRHIEVVEALGSASVGQAFLCRIETSDGYGAKPCVVKMLKPDVQNRFARERPVLERFAEEVDGEKDGLMSGQLKARLDTIRDELNFNAEGGNLESATKAYGDATRKYQSVLSNRKLEGVPPNMNVLVLELVEGDPVDKFLSKTIAERVDGILDGTVEKDGLHQSKTMAECIRRREELAQVMDDLDKCQNQLMELASHWFDTAVFKNGFFHGDLHAGNIMIGKELDKITMIDFGNAMSIGNVGKPSERTVLKGLICAAAAQDADAFLENFAKLVPAERKRDFDDVSEDMKAALADVFRKGSLNDSGSRVYVALSLLQRKGFSTSAAIYNFVQSQSRLQNAIEEVGLKIRQVKALYDSQVPENPFADGLQDDKLAVGSVDFVRKMFGPWYALRNLVRYGGGGTFECDMQNFIPAEKDGVENPSEWRKAVDGFLNCYIGDGKDGEKGQVDLRQALEGYVIPLHRSLQDIKDPKANGDQTLKTRIDDLVTTWQTADRESKTPDETRRAAETLLKGLQDVQKDAALEVVRYQAPQIREYGEAVSKVIRDMVESMSIPEQFSFAKDIGGVPIANKLRAEVDRQEDVINVEIQKADEVWKTGIGSVNGLSLQNISNTSHWDAYKALAKKISFSSEVEKLLAQKGGGWMSDKASREAFAKDWLENVRTIYLNCLRTHNCPKLASVESSLIYKVDQINKDKAEGHKLQVRDGKIWDSDGTSMSYDQFAEHEQYADNFKSAKDDVEVVYYADIDSFANIARPDGADVNLSYEVPLALFEKVYRPGLFRGLQGLNDNVDCFNDICLSCDALVAEIKLGDAEIKQMARLMKESESVGSGDFEHSEEFYADFIRASYKDDIKNIFKALLKYAAVEHVD